MTLCNSFRACCIQSCNLVQVQNNVQLCDGDCLHSYASTAAVPVLYYYYL